MSATASQFDTEHAVARAIRDGDLPSPQRFANMLLIALRITGTGLSYRDTHKEYVWRDPSLYLNPEFLERCQGLSVILEHPEGAVLNTEEFRNRIVGMIALPYIKGEEVWGVAKILDMAAADLLETEKLSTSPAVILRSAGKDQKVTVDGKTILIEGKAFLLDSLAICWRGVWDKGGPAAGVDNSNSSTGVIMDSSHADFVAAQVKADPTYRLFSDAAPPPLTGEPLLDYRKRLVSRFQQYSKMFGSAKLETLTCPHTLGAIEAQVFADATAALHAGATVPAGTLVAVVAPDASGRPVTSYRGSAGACWDRFAPPVRYVTKFKTGRAS